MCGPRPSLRINQRPSSCAAIPAPVSLTWSRTRPPSATPSTVHATSMRPGTPSRASVNLTTLPSRLSTICRSFSRSARAHSPRGAPDHA